MGAYDTNTSKEHKKDIAYTAKLLQDDRPDGRCTI